MSTDTAFEHAPAAGAPASTSGPEQGPGAQRGAGRRATLYVAAGLALTLCGVGAIAEANRRYAPELYHPSYMSAVAEVQAGGEGYGVFDLNIDIRKLREEQIKRLPEKPELIILGASQWQEAGAELAPGRKYFNAHVHRDYYEDVLGMVELLVRHDRLPKDLVITLRDKIFTPVAKRKDFLWLPGIPYYQAMADRLSLPRLKLWERHPLQRPRELVSLPTLFANVTRWHTAEDWPYPTTKTRLTSLDILRPDGSITWSKEHQAIFTRDRARKQATSFADASHTSPPQIDPKGVEAIDSLLSYLGVRGVRVHLAHPPFNPIYFDRVQGSPYMDGLHEVEAVTRELADRHKLAIFGSFDPKHLGCTSDMFIDAEHSNADCLSRLLGDLEHSLDAPAPAPTAAPAVTAEAHTESPAVAEAIVEHDAPAAEPDVAPARHQTASSVAASGAAAVDVRPVAAAADSESVAAAQAQAAAAIVAARLRQPIAASEPEVQNAPALVATPSPEPAAAQLQPRSPGAARAAAARPVASPKIIAVRRPSPAPGPAPVIVRPATARHAPPNRSPGPKHIVVSAPPRMVWPGDMPPRTR